MNKEFRKILLDKLDKELAKQNFYVADAANKYFIYHRKNKKDIEIIQIAEDEYEPYLTVSVSIAFTETVEEKSNIDNKIYNGDYGKLSADDCLDKYYLRGNIGIGFYFGNVYLTFCQGIVGVRSNDKKPSGIRVKKFHPTTYQDVCNLIIKRLPKAYAWLEKKRSIRKYQCPCCGYYTLISKGMHELCPVCHWEDNNFAEADDGNGISLNEAKKNYIQYGAYRRDLKRHTRRPRRNEMLFSLTIHEYLKLISRYTSFSKNNILKEVKKGGKGKFKSQYDCALFLKHHKEYGIRFNDDMKPEEFNNVYETLLNDLGEPEFFSEWEGYIWKRRRYIITFGLVALNYNYEVPMILVKRRVPIFSNCLNYKKYTEIADSMNNPLIERGINVQRTSYYKIGYCKEFGFNVHVKISGKYIYINYNKSELSVIISPLVQEINSEIIQNQNRYIKEIRIHNDSELKLKLEELLEETKEYHGLKKG